METFSSFIDIPPRILKECRVLEQFIVRVLPQGFESDEDILSFMMYENLYDWDFCDSYVKDENGIWILNPNPGPKRERPFSLFEKSQLYNYFFITGQYEKARKALFYALYLQYKEPRGDYLVHFVGPEKQIEWFERNYQTLDRYHLWGFFAYINYYPQMHQYPWFAQIVEKSDEKHRTSHQRAKEGKERYHDHMALLFGNSESYLTWVIGLGDFERARAVWQEFFEWYDWYQAQEPKPRTSAYSPHGTYEWRPIVGAIKYWFAAMDDPAHREELARASLEHFQQWFIREHIVSKSYTTFAYFPNDVLLSMMMRIDLDVDLEPARKFVRYFKPLFMAVPRIWDKVQALGVEYEPPQVLPAERIAELRAQFEQREAERESRYKRFFDETRHFRGQ